MKKVLGKKLTKDFEGSYIYYDDEDIVKLSEKEISLIPKRVIWKKSRNIRRSYSSHLKEGEDMKVHAVLGSHVQRIVHVGILIFVLLTAGAHSACACKSRLLDMYNLHTSLFNDLLFGVLYVI